jgi:hypothetical protein
MDMDAPDKNGVWLSAFAARAQAAEQLRLIKGLLDSIQKSCRTAGMPVEKDVTKILDLLDPIDVDLLRLGMLMNGQKGIRQPDHQITLDII